MRLSLRLKLALIALLLLAVPYSGVRLAAIVSTSLLESRQQALLFSARAVAQALSGREGLFDRELFHSLDRSRDLYLFELTNPMRLNGKPDDWQPHLDNALFFGREHILSSSSGFNPDGAGFRHLVGRRGEYLYAIFLVTDDRLVYRQKNSLALDRSDHLQITIEDRSGNLNRYIITASEPGWVNGFLTSRDFDSILPARREKRIQGVWAETAEGYILEIRLPLDMVANRLAFAVADVDDPSSRVVESVIGTASIDQPEKIGWLLPTSSDIENILASLNQPQSKIHVVDSNHHIRASYGTLSQEETDNSTSQGTSLLAGINRLLSPLYTLFTEPVPPDLREGRVQPAALEIRGVSDALLGSSSVSRYRLEKNGVEVMAAATPLYENDKIVGAVVVEQTTSSILALKNRVIEESIGLTLLVLTFGGCGLLFFAFRLSSRIRKLRDQASSAVDENGRILSIATPFSAKDEIGDLSRTLTSILAQLKAQEQYREKMADNLEHEMRTPLASVSASLKNMAREMGDQPEHITDYLNWALGDIKRMEDLLTAIRDATTLRNALARGQKESFNLAEAVDVWLHHSWRQTFDSVRFDLSRPEEPVMISGDPDRIRQMLDKLIENGVAFHTAGTAIELHLAKGRKDCQFTVFNQGPAIPEEARQEIFDSMVSIRTGNDTTPHLGLGLYIARHIALFHGGTITAANVAAPSPGVCFTITLPTLP